MKSKGTWESVVENLAQQEVVSKGIRGLAWPSSWVATTLALIMHFHHWLCQPHLCHQVDHLLMLLTHGSLGCSFQGGYSWDISKWCFWLLPFARLLGILE